MKLVTNLHSPPSLLLFQQFLSLRDVNPPLSRHRAFLSTAYVSSGSSNIYDHTGRNESSLSIFSDQRNLLFFMFFVSV